MRRATLLSLGLASLLALGAVLVGRAWMVQQAQRTRDPGMTTIVVAARDLNFGNQIGPADVREVRWPAESKPAGAFANVAALALGERSRQALQHIGANEPVVASNVTGPEQRAILSAVVTPGMRAFAIRVDDVVGVGGFVLPNDRIDVILVRADEGQRGNDAFRSDVLLQNIRVLGIDQDPDGSRETARVARAVTLEVTAEQAQLLSLAAQSGSLRLALRNQGSTNTDTTRTITLRDLRAQGSVTPTSAPASARPTRRAAAANPGASIVVMRGEQRAVVQVLPE